MKNIPQTYKRFNDDFQSLARIYGYYTVFEDYLSLFINAFSFNYNINLKAIQEKYSQEQRYCFGRLIKSTIAIINDELRNEYSWFDFFGGFYELQALSKKQFFAQYFTPKNICDLMVSISVGSKKRSSFSDPCCGSGRFSLSFNSKNLGAFHFLIDIDYTCTKMSALNLMLHGIEGVVVCDDTLWPGSSFKGAFYINRKLRFSGVPEIEFLQGADQAYDIIRERFPSKKENKATKTNNEDIKEIIDENRQYSMF